VITDGDAFVYCRTAATGQRRTTTEESPLTIQQELTERYREFSTAVVTKDRRWLEDNLADDFHIVLAPTGGLISKAEYIAHTMTIVDVGIEMEDVEVLERGDWATVQFTALVFEKMADLSTLDSETQAIRAKMGLDAMSDVIAEQARHYYSATWRRTPRGWQCVLQSYFGPLPD
jgi:hypothetical protein